MWKSLRSLASRSNHQTSNTKCVESVGSSRWEPRGGVAGFSNFCNDDTQDPTDNHSRLKSEKDYVILSSTLKLKTTHNSIEKYKNETMRSKNAFDVRNSACWLISVVLFDALQSHTKRRDCSLCQRHIYFDEQRPTLSSL